MITTEYENNYPFYLRMHLKGFYLCSFIIIFLSIGIFLSEQFKFAKNLVNLISETKNEIFITSDNNETEIIKNLTQTLYANVGSSYIGMYEITNETKNNTIRKIGHSNIKIARIFNDNYGILKFL